MTKKYTHEAAAIRYLTMSDQERALLDAELNAQVLNAVLAAYIKPAFEFTIDRIDAMLKAEGMPPTAVFTRQMKGISREAQACGALERKFRMTGLDLEHVRFWMKDGLRVKMLLGERVDELRAYSFAKLMVDRGVPFLDPADIPLRMQRVETNTGEFIDLPYYGKD